ncbi:MAG: TonB-dependent receptor domain-containing protein [Pseudomonadota bacterium]
MSTAPSTRDSLHEEARARGRRAGCYGLPTVFTSVRPEMRIAREEIFGPVLATMVFESENEAVALANGYSWRSITGYLDYEDASLIDVNPRPSPIRLSIQSPQFAEQISQEFQLLYAVFADLNYNLTDRWRLNAGLRWNDEDVSNSFSDDGLIDGDPFDRSGSQGDPTGRIGLDYTPRAGLMFYGSVGTGYRAGFFSTRSDSVSGGPVANEVEPEKILAYELGMKSVLPDDRGYFNVAAFYGDAATAEVRLEYNFRGKFDDCKWRVYGSGLNLANEELLDFHRGDVIANTGGSAPGKSA